MYGGDKWSHDIWLETSKKRTEKLDSDFIAVDRNEHIRLELPKETHITNDRICLV